MQASSYPLPIVDGPTFDATVARPGVTVIDFTARWCGPCKALAPVLAGLATDYAGRVQVIAVDVDDSQRLAQRYGVRAMPTVVLVRDGVEVGRVVGSRPRTFLAGVIDRALAGDRAIAAP